MEENQQSQQSPQVSFPQVREPEAGRGSNAKVLIAIVGVLLIVLVGGWLILGNREGSATPTPTPVGGLSTFPTPEVASTPEASPTATPAPVDKSEVKVEILNGTGVPGEASFLQKELEKLGFTSENITAGNADEQDATETTATYSRDLAQATADEITQRLEEVYTAVRTRRATTSGDFDVSITTGPRKGGSTTKPATAKPTATATATPKASASASPTSSPTATP